MKIMAFDSFYTTPAAVVAKNDKHYIYEGTVIPHVGDEIVFGYAPAQKVKRVVIDYASDMAMIFC